MKDPHDIIIQPHITERSVAQSYGNPLVKDEKDNVRKYTFIVAKNSTKIEIKSAIEAIYNAGKKKGEAIEVTAVNTVTIRGKLRRVRTKHAQYPVAGHRADSKKAIITLKAGQQLEDFGV